MVERSSTDEAESNNGPGGGRAEPPTLGRFVATRVAVVVLVTIVVAGITWLVMTTRQPVYETRFALLMQTNTKLDRFTFDDAQSALQREDVGIDRTIATILSSRPVLRRSLRHAGLDPESTDVHDRVFIRPGTKILELSVRSTDQQILGRIVPTLERQARAELASTYHGVYLFRRVQNATRTAQIAPQVGRRVELFAVLAITIFGGLALLDIRYELRRQRRRAEASPASEEQGASVLSMPDPPTA